jgi:hypothetical protein
VNIFLWILQALLAAHTAIGAVWKFSNSESVASLSVIPHGVWLALALVELFCALALVLPALYRPAGSFVPAAAAFIAAEMVLFSGLQAFSGHPNYGHVIYWLVVAAFCAFIAYARSALRPLK